MSPGLTLDYETADKITLLNLQDQLHYLLKEVREYEEEGQWMHPEDYQRSVGKLIPALRVLIAHYGGTF